MKRALFALILALTLYLVALVNHDASVPTMAPIYTVFTLVLLTLFARSWLVGNTFF